MENFKGVNQTTLDVCTSKLYGYLSDPKLQVTTSNHNPSLKRDLLFATAQLHVADPSGKTFIYLVVPGGGVPGTD